MRILLLITILALAQGVARGQYIPNSAQAFQFAPLYNPAFTGIESYGDLKLSYRYQWAAFKEYAPKFINLSYNFRLKQPLDLTLNALRTSQADMRGLIPKRKQVTHGFGANLFNEEVGMIDRLGAGINYSIHYPISKNMRLAGGVAAVIENTKLRVEEIYLGSEAPRDPFYESLLNGSSNHTELGVRAGALLYSDQFYLGFSYFPLVNTTLKTSELMFNEPFYKGSFQGGFSFPINADATLKPSIMAVWQENNEILIDYSMKFYLQNKAWFGATYRDIETGVAAAGLNINNNFSVSYSYEFSMGKLKTFSGGSHDLVLSARLNNFKRLMQQTW